MFDLTEYIATEYSNLSLSFMDLAIIAKYSEGRDLVVELGTCMGNTARMMSRLAQKVITIDIFEDVSQVNDQAQRTMYYQQFVARPHYYNDIKTFINKWRSNVEVIQGNTAKMSTCCSPETIDTLFIDADHSYLGVKLDYEAWFSKVKVGGYFLFHDCCPDTSGVSQVWPYYLDTLSQDTRIKEVEPEVQVMSNGTSIKVFQKIGS